MARNDLILHPRKYKGEDGYRVFSVRVKETTVQRLEELSAQTNRSRNELINILLGDMSFVGPRPALWNQYDLIAERDRYGANDVLPGLTGWAQVNGYRGDTSITKRVEYDLYYIENWSLGLDFKIIFLTFFKGFVNKNAY